MPYRRGTIEPRAAARTASICGCSLMVELRASNAMTSGSIPPTRSKAGRFDTGSLTEIMVKDGVRILDAWNMERVHVRQCRSGCAEV